MRTLQASDIFHGVQFCIDFAAFSNLSFKRKQEIRGDIVNHGGILSYILTKQTNYLVTSKAERTLASYKGRTGQKYGIAVVSYEFLAECIKAAKSQTHQKKAKAVKFVHLPDIKKLRYCNTLGEALGAYTVFYNQQTRAPYNMTKVESVLSHSIGSDKMIQMKISDYCHEEDVILPPDVANLVDVLWNEATGSLSDVLAVPVNTIKLEDVEKAEGILLLLKRSFDNVEDASKVKKLSDEFFSIIPHKSKTLEIASRQEIARKQDLCQLIKDMVNISESTNWQARRSVYSKYRSLKCHIECLQRGSDEFQSIQECVNSSESGSLKINILNIFSIRRPVEDATFSREIENKKLLFHSSKVTNFVGILSRGLLLPRIVVDDFGGTRSDAGMLGSGIYFASSARKFALDLTSPPYGYNSCHGDDEFVIYNGNQQKIRYLVEFVLPDDKVIPRDDVSLDSGFSDEEMEVDEEESSVDISDVMSVVDPLSKIEAGLKGTGDKVIPLQSVHIRARLLDLAAQVVVFQAYKNSSSTPIEAKYVFPLDDMAAVCGFEAFINDKHIVGEVKEKEQAHKEYREAISQGHGAYLMDEETPDVFTVSVGNLPPGSQVLIKITYVTELLVDGEHICFSLPGSLAPWKRSKALEEITQTDVYSVPIEEEQLRDLKDFSVNVSIEMPFEIRSIDSPTHPIGIKRSATKAVVVVEPGQSMENGFQLLIGLAEIHVPRMWVERHTTKPDSQACMLAFYPEFESESPQVVEVLFLVDVSCSMKGSPIEEAKKILLLCLTHMNSNWIFNIILFGSINMTGLAIDDPFYLPLISFSVGISVLYITSSSAHLFNCMSANSHRICFFFDYAAIGFYTFTAGQALFFYSRSTGAFLWFIYDSLIVFQIVSSFFSFLLTFFCCVSSQPRWQNHKALLKVFIVVLNWLVITSPYTVRLLLCEKSDPSNNSASMSYFKRHMIFCALGAFVYAARIPERFMTGVFDSFGQSHNLQHILVAMGIQQAFNTAHVDLHQRRDVLAARFASQPTVMNTFGAAILVLIGHLFIVLLFAKNSELFPCSRRKDEAFGEAEKFIKSLKANKGSTELWRVLQKLCLLPAISTADHPRNLFLISDGHVTEEETSLNFIRKNCQCDRLFTFGVGSTANRYLLRFMAKAGAGASEFFDSKAKSKWERKASLTAEVDGKRLSTIVEKRNRKEYIISISKEFSVTSKFTSFVAIEHREKNEKFEEGKGPSIQDLLKEEVVDILPYIDWEEKIEDKQKREQTTEEWLEEQLKKAKVLETCAVLRCERLYQDVLNKARDKLGPNHKLSYDAAFSLVNFYLNVMGDKSRASIVFEQTQLLKDSATADYDAFVVCKSMRTSEEETSCEEETSSEEEVSRSEEDSFGEDYEKLEIVKDGETFEFPREEIGDEREERCDRAVFRRGPSITRVQADGAEEQLEETIKDDLEKYSLLLQSDALVERAKFSMSRVESTYESVHEELEMGKGLSRNVLKGLKANLEEEKRSLDFQIESALPLTSNNINVAQGFSCERTSGLFGVPDLPAPRKTMIPPLPAMLATSSSPPPAYEGAASPPPPPPTPPLPPGLVTASSIPPVYERGAPSPAPELLQGLPLPPGLAKTASIPPARLSRPPPSSIPTSSLLSEPDAYCMSLRSPARESQVMALPRDRRRRVEKSVLHLEKPDGVYYRKARLARIPMEKTKEKTIVPPPGVEQDTTDKICFFPRSAKSFPASQRMLSPLKVELGINDSTSREEKDHTRSPSEMQYYSISSKRMKLKEIFNKQKADGFWDTNDLTIIGANKNDFLDFLGNAGAKSLGDFFQVSGTLFQTYNTSAQVDQRTGKDDAIDVYTLGIWCKLGSSW
ncbi:Protein mono-ADP-ribosyltransferase PARP4 [Acropora cervicornis]|uniref:Poly [ADP-ribose] polymerase n=1 Tax=Acropora cervicornis TaxID=6130 RepID=A0AAD9V1P9_ACRCE|nr:Protein mono-ADP-ribosyltransferase PARP4 [Acropora cervicornis]